MTAEVQPEQKPQLRPLKRARQAWLLVVALVAVLCACFAVFTPRSAGSLSFGFGSVAWPFYASETVHLLNSSPDGPKFITVTYNLGPLRITKRRYDPGITEKPAPQPLGTNALHVGDRIFDPASQRELWLVIALEREHEFEDGSVHDGVLVRSAINGGEAWMMRENLGKGLVGR